LNYMNCSYTNLIKFKSIIGMTSFILVIHLIVAITLVALVLLQRSEGGGLGIGGTGDFMSSRSAGNVLTKLTAIFGAVFFSTSLFLAVLSSVQDSDSIVSDLQESKISIGVNEADVNNLPDLN
jgi:preprotein translocase subunit SecG